MLSFFPKSFGPFHLTAQNIHRKKVHVCFPFYSGYMELHDSVVTDILSKRQQTNCPLLLAMVSYRKRHTYYNGYGLLRGPLKSNLSFKLRQLHLDLSSEIHKTYCHKTDDNCMNSQAAFHLLYLPLAIKKDLDVNSLICIIFSSHFNSIEVDLDVTCVSSPVPKPPLLLFRNNKLPLISLYPTKNIIQDT